MFIELVESVVVGKIEILFNRRFDTHISSLFRLFSNSKYNPDVHNITFCGFIPDLFGLFLSSAEICAYDGARCKQRYDDQWDIRLGPKLTMADK